MKFFVVFQTPSILSIILITQFPFNSPILISGQEEVENAYADCGGMSCETSCDHALKISCTTNNHPPELVVCSGSLLYLPEYGDWIVTANHCFDRVENLMDSCTFSIGNDAYIAPISIIEEFTAYSMNGDGIRMFQLDPKAFSPRNRNIYLPDSGVDLSFDNLKRKRLTFCAWGLISETQFTPEVKCMPFTLLTKGHCKNDAKFDQDEDKFDQEDDKFDQEDDKFDQEDDTFDQEDDTFDQEDDTFDQDDTFCAGVETGCGLTCRGDSGGALILENDDDDTFGKRYLIGIFSKGRESLLCESSSCDNYEIGNQFMNVSSLFSGLLHRFPKNLIESESPSSSTSDSGGGESSGMQKNYCFSLFGMQILMILSNFSSVFI